jgi:hypothetical protein
MNKQKHTTLTFDKDSQRKLNLFTARITEILDGESVNRKEIIAILVEGYKNPNFNERKYLKTVRGEEVIENVS